MVLCGFVWFCVVLCGFMWFYVVLCGFFVVSFGFFWFFFVLKIIRYSIIHCEEVNKVRLMRIRNPWGRGVRRERSCEGRGDRKDEGRARERESEGRRVREVIRVT